MHMKTGALLGCVEPNPELMGVRIDNYKLKNIDGRGTVTPHGISCAIRRN